MSIRTGAITYYANFGLRGLAIITAYRLTGRPKQLTALAPGIPNAVHLRTRTTDISSYSEVLLRKEYELDLPFSPEIILDAGANVGMASVYFANRYPAATVIAVEPEPANFQMLSQNVRPYPNVRAVHAALWNRDGEIAVNPPDPASGASGEWGFVTGEGSGRMVRAITIPTLLREANIAKVDMAKIDIEGAEQEIFEDASWLAELRCLQVELHDRFRPGCSEKVEAAMAGFSRSQHGETVTYIRSRSDV